MSERFGKIEEQAAEDCQVLSGVVVGFNKQGQAMDKFLSAANMGQAVPGGNGQKRSVEFDQNSINSGGNAINNADSSLVDKMSTHKLIQKNQDYLNLINKIIHEEIKYYTLPIYSFDYIEKNTDDLTLTVDNDIFLELLCLQIRGETVKFSSFLKKKTEKREKER